MQCDQLKRRKFISLLGGTAAALRDWCSVSLNFPDAQ
jgi:hypothetical protein